jgi:hypothetical protein
MQRWRNRDNVSSEGLAQSRTQCKSVLVHLMANRQARKISSAGIMAWKDQKRKHYLGVSDTGRLRNQESRLFNTGVPDLQNPEHRNPETGTSTGVSDTRRLRSQESRLFNTGVPKSRNAKRRNVEIDTPTKSFRRPGNNSISKFRIPGVEVLKHFTTGVSKCRIAEM